MGKSMSDTAVVATYGYRHEAEFARETLRAAGIDSVLVGDDAGGAYAGMSFTRRLTLLVRVDELEHARAVLSDADTPPGSPPDGADPAA
jgi:hypothetical protein